MFGKILDQKIDRKVSEKAQKTIILSSVKQLIMLKNGPDFKLASNLGNWKGEAAARSCRAASVVQCIEQQYFPNIPITALNLPKMRQQTLC